MKILYLTTSRHPLHYQEMVATKKKVPNPSNQNFHTKLINILGKFHEVQVISSHPMENGLFVGSQSFENYFYPGFINLKVIRNFNIINRGSFKSALFVPDVVFVDVNNATLLTLAKRIKTNQRVKVIGLLTDNPLNITNSNSQYAENVFKLSRICNGFIALTPGLLRLFNIGDKPSFVIPGFIDFNPAVKENKGEYAFFAGALYEKYGVLSLIEAFSKTTVPFKLIIAGHGPLSEKLRHLNCSNIEFVGLITPQEVASYSVNAKVNINPRLIDSQIDLYSVPSKMLDYINSGTVTLSTNNPIIKDIVGDEVFWIQDNNSKTILEALNSISGNYPIWENKAKQAQKLLRDRLSLPSIQSSINYLINKL